MWNVYVSSEKDSKNNEMKNFLHICLVVSLTVIGVLHLHLHPLCYGLSQDVSSQQEEAKRDSGACVQ